MNKQYELPCDKKASECIETHTKEKLTLPNISNNLFDQVLSDLDLQQNVQHHHFFIDVNKT